MIVLKFVLKIENFLKICKDKRYAYKSNDLMVRFIVAFIVENKGFCKKENFKMFKNKN